jgi:hypothetical protein
MNIVNCEKVGVLGLVGCMSQLRGVQTSVKYRETIVMTTKLLSQSATWVNTHLEGGYTSGSGRNVLFRYETEVCIMFEMDFRCTLQAMP